MHQVLAGRQAGVARQGRGRRGRRAAGEGQTHGRVAGAEQESRLQEGQRVSCIILVFLFDIL